ncbi:MAG: hypothetical protein M0R75_07510 [Dehalococcoidia bacterium]|nr:hypothetical protein [Dehalococcoidia bacterium]
MTDAARSFRQHSSPAPTTPPRARVVPSASGQRPSQYRMPQMRAGTRVPGQQRAGQRRTQQLRG